MSPRDHYDHDLDGEPHAPPDLSEVLGEIGAAWDDPKDHDSFDELGATSESRSLAVVSDVGAVTRPIPEPPMPLEPQVMVPGDRSTAAEADEPPHLTGSRGPWLSRPSAAAYLDVAEDDLVTVTEDLPVFELNGDIRYAQSDLDGLLALVSSDPGESDAAETSVDHRWPEVWPAVVEISRNWELVRTLSNQEGVRGLVVRYRVDLEDAGQLVLTYTIAKNHERWIHCEEVHSDSRYLGRLLRGGRLGIREVDGGLSAELSALVISSAWSRLRMMSVEQIAEHTRTDIAAALTELGATAIGTRGDIEGNTTSRKNFLAVHFPIDNGVVPVWAYIITRVLALLRNEPA